MENVGAFKPIEAIPLDLLKEPLVWFFAEHYRHRDLCRRLSEASRSVVFEDRALREILKFLDGDLPLHVIDEEDDLFPLLRRRCEAEDEIEKVLGMLSAEHAADLNTANAVKAVVARALAEQRGLGALSESRDLVEAFCQQQKRHIAVENAVVLPIARHRLSPDDLMGLSQRLAARRGLRRPYQAAS